jgi:hypothetical protein
MIRKSYSSNGSHETKIIYPKYKSARMHFTEILRIARKLLKRLSGYLRWNYKYLFHFEQTNRIYDHLQQT